MHWSTDIDGELTEHALTEKLTSLGYRVTRYIYPPGTCFPDHHHDEDKIDGVLSGQFKLRINGQSLILSAGDCLAVPRGVMHSAEVVGDIPVISLDAVSNE